MIFTALPPKDVSADANFETLAQEMDGKHEERRKKRTLPAEWAPQSAIQLTWPHAGTDWAPMLKEVTECYLKMAFEMASRQPLMVVTPEPDVVAQLLERRLPEDVRKNICILEAPTDDTWARDHAFITVEDTDGWHLLDFRFNGWGGKFEAQRDNAINAAAVYAQGAVDGHYDDCNDFELEGGAIESDGQGTILTTAECLLNANRRREGDAVPHVNKGAVERLLGERLGAKRILWLNHGYLAGDDTDSHIDTLARLCPNDTILYVKCDDPADEHYAELKAMEEELQAFRTDAGAPFRLIPLPMPDACMEEGDRLPATYANFLIMNTAVLVPTYGQPDNDAKALEQVAQAFPGREVVGVDCRPLIIQHGSLHCCTMQFPRGVYKFGHQE